jgi:hypothetical protein
VKATKPGVDRILERLEDVLPADHLDGIHMALEEAGDRLPKKAVRLVFERLHMDEVALGVPQAPQLCEGPGKVLGGLDEEPALLERLLHRTVDFVEREEVGRVLDEVDDVVDRLRELVDVLPVERGDVCVFRSSMICRVRSSPLFSSSLICACRTSRSGNARKRAST